jgi:hypothetical protein
MVELAPRPNGYDDLHELTARSHAACAELARDDVEVHLLRSLYLPEDGTCVMLFDAASAPAVDEASRLAGLSVRRMSVLLSRPLRDT